MKEVSSLELSLNKSIQEIPRNIKQEKCRNVLMLEESLEEIIRRLELKVMKNQVSKVEISNAISCKRKTTR